MPYFRTHAMKSKPPILNSFAVRSILNRQAFALLAASIATVVAGEAATISVQTGFPDHFRALAPADAAGVQNVGNWNSLPGDGGAPGSAHRNFTNATDSDGVTTAVDFSIANNNGWSSRVFDNGHDTSNNGKLFNTGAKDITTNAGAPNGTGFFSLVPGSLWDVYLYTASEQTGQNVNVNVTGAVTSATFYFTSQGASGNDLGTYTTNFVQATNTDVDGTRDVANYVKWSNVEADALGQIKFDFTGTAGNAAFPGFQITAVPEPSSALFMAAGIGMLGMLRRRRFSK